MLGIGGAIWPVFILLLSPGLSDTIQASRSATEWEQAVLAPTRKTPLLFIGVISAPANSARRADVRASWMKDPLVTDNVLVQTVFVVGQPEPGSQVAAALESEQQEHGDILLLPVQDTYEDLTKKTLTFLQWFLGDMLGDEGMVRSPGAKYVLKLDDDTYPHLGRLLQLLVTRPDSYTYMGLFHRCAAVKRIGKNAESPEDFGDNLFPTYASGSGYVLSSALARNLIESIAHPSLTRKLLDVDAMKEAFTSRSGDTSATFFTEEAPVDADHPTMLHNEDANTGFWISQQNPKSTPVEFASIPATLNGCSGDDVLSMNLEAGVMPCMWARQQFKLKSICCKPRPISSLLQVRRQAQQC
mmetsp:Transcript_46027/g.99962  ORF Transcript_46027/g.99962 Transcript_46027/m.99962 type:complete len:357 (-) Transcript_46027:51-1121(-)